MDVVSIDRLRWSQDLEGVYATLGFAVARRWCGDAAAKVLRSNSATCPDWYREWQDLDDRRFWDAAVGEVSSHSVRLVSEN